uniref:Uncharacterized protein n=1 Tax=Octopus bimaculoides TaxID=37653 RepID=A0A0L8GJQ1_OCTBM
MLREREGELGVRKRHSYMVRIYKHRGAHTHTQRGFVELKGGDLILTISLLKQSPLMLSPKKKKIKK